jgi:hypothetical protein
MGENGQALLIVNPAAEKASHAVFAVNEPITRRRRPLAARLGSTARYQVPRTAIPDKPPQAVLFT